MVAKQRIRMANEKHSKNITQRGNVAKSTVSLTTATVRREKVIGATGNQYHTHGRNSQSKLYWFLLLDQSEAWQTSPVPVKPSFHRGTVRRNKEVLFKSSSFIFMSRECV